jgi:hypothetical protein
MDGWDPHAPVEESLRAFDHPDEACKRRSREPSDLKEASALPEVYLYRKSRPLGMDS